MWNCSKCEQQNPDNQVRCSICGTAKPSVDAKSLKSSQQKAKWYQQPWFYIAVIIVAMGIGILGYHFIQISIATPSSETSANMGCITIAPESAETNNSIVQPEDSDNIKTEIQYSSIMGNGILNSRPFAVSDGSSVYFTKGENSIYKMAMDGSNITQISSEQMVYCLNIDGEWIYYISYIEDGASLNRINKNGSSNELIQTYSTLVDDLQFVNDSYYYIKFTNRENDGGYNKPVIVKARITDGGKESVVWTSDREFWLMFCINSSIYAEDAIGEQYIVDSETGSSQPNNAKIMLKSQFDLDFPNMGQPSYDEAGQKLWSYNIVDDKIYYTIPDKKFVYWDINGEKGSYEIEPCDRCDIGSIAGYWVFFITTKTMNDIEYVDYYMLKNSGNDTQCIKYYSTQY